MATPPPGYLSNFARMSHALQLRREGKTYQQIADITGLQKPEKAQRLVSNSIKRILRETAEEIRSIELSRLELLITTLWDRAIADLDGEVPDYRRFDRLKGLIEAKLRWCGAQPITDTDPLHGRISITINKFTNGTPSNGLPPPPLELPAPASREDIEAELALLTPETDHKEQF